VKKLFSRTILAGAILVLVVQGVACADWDKYEFHVENGTLMRGPEAFTVRAMETPDLIRPGVAADALPRAIAQIGEVGGDAVCFDLYGFDEKGKSLSDDAVAAVNQLQRDTKEYRVSAICRVLDGDAPQDAKLRKAAARTAAQALKDQAKLIYWIDGPDCAALVAEFRKHAPRLAVAAPEGAPIVVVSSPSAIPENTPVLLAGALPHDLHGGVSFVVPNDETHRAALDKAMADPIEAQPWAPDNSILSDEERAEGWIALFDGKSFDGWVVTGDKDGFGIRDGMIEWVKGGGQAVRSRARYDNFALRLDWKIEDGGNSGIYLRAPRAARASKVGMEFQLMGDHGKEPGTKTTGALYDAAAPLVNASKPAGEWNSVEILLDGQHLKATLNGQLIHDRNLDEHEKLRLRNHRGFIALQDHNHYVAFRNIRLKPL